MQGSSIKVAAVPAHVIPKTDEEHPELHVRKRTSSSRANKPETVYPNLEIDSSESNPSSSEASSEERRRLERLEKAQKMKLAIQVI